MSAIASTGSTLVVEVVPIVGITQIGRADQAVGPNTSLVRKMMEEEYAPAATIHPDLEAGAIARKRIRSYRPGSIRRRQRHIIHMIAIIKDKFAMPRIRQRDLGALFRPVGEIR